MGERGLLYGFRAGVETGTPAEMVRNRFRLQPLQLQATLDTAGDRRQLRLHPPIRLSHHTSRRGSRYSFCRHCATLSPHYVNSAI